MYVMLFNAQLFVFDSPMLLKQKKHEAAALVHIMLLRIALVSNASCTVSFSRPTTSAYNYAVF